MVLLPIKNCVKLLKRHLKRLILALLLIIIPYILFAHPVFDQIKQILLQSKTSSYFRFVNIHDRINGSSDLNSCTIPNLELWPEEFKQYFKKPNPLFCSAEENWVYIVNGTYRFSTSAKQKYGKLLCEAITLVRGDEFAVLNGKRIKPLNDGDAIQSDFSEVRCVAQSGQVFKTLLSGVLQTESIKSRPVPEPRLNILMFGFDSVSKMTWMRTLPETHKYFTSSLGGVVLQGYNIVGDGTPQALLPILTGKNETQLPESRRGHNAAKMVDGHPWIWKEMTKLGYVTQWGEDGPKFGTFTYRMLGFDKQPVDHYMRPFYIRAEMQYNQHKQYCLGSIPRHVNMMNWILELYKVYPDKPKFSFLFHSEFSHDGYGELGMADLDMKAFLEYMNDVGYLNNTVVILMSDHGARFQDIRSFTQGKYEERMPYFGFRFPDWFQKEYPEAILNLNRNQHRLTTPYDIHETLIDIINTKPTGYKDNVHFSKMLNLRKRKINLKGSILARQKQKSNKEKHFPEISINQTHKMYTNQSNEDISDGQLSDLIVNESMAQNHSLSEANQTGISLLRVIPEKRLCSDAGIAAHWCTCMQWVDIDTQNYKVKNAANQLISTINNHILKPYRKWCEEITLKTLLSSVLYRPNDMVLKFKQSQDFDGRNPEFASDYDIKEEFYQITIETLPAYAKFEATVKFDVHFNRYYVSKAEISRINKYSDQPKCVQDKFPHLRPYCYCKK